ncbi:MAG: hypothetical protein HYU66_07145 [Armatimonadetes bacterium]|nr:hypothetical protein [Armatimonadota bacterium]
MKQTLRVLFLVGLLGSGAWAASNDTCTIHYEVQAINELNIVAGSVTLTVNAATAGSQPDQASASTTYNISNNTGAAGASPTDKITGAINTDMPAGTTLKVTAGATTGGTSAGAVTLTSVAADLVTGVANVAETGLSLGFTLDATVSAGVVASASKTFTMTIVAQ